MINYFGTCISGVSFPIGATQNKVKQKLYRQNETQRQTENKKWSELAFDLWCQFSPLGFGGISRMDELNGSW